MASKLLTLPNEVQHLIVARIPHPADLKALCLVSKHVSAIATEYLYRDLVLPYSDSNRDWIDLRYLIQSRGLQHVRTLTVDSGENTNTYGFCKPLDQLLPKLPMKSLTHFWYGPLGQPTEEGLRYLLHQQDKLTNLQLTCSLMAPSLEELMREEGTAIRSLKSLTELTLNLGNERHTSAEMYSELINMLETARLKKVSLSTDVCSHTHTEEESMKRILKSALSSSLTHISLTNVYLPHSNGQHLQLDNLHFLRHLEIRECTNLASSLDLFRQPILKSFVVHFCPMRDLDADAEDLEAAIELLQRFRSLNRLVFSSEATVTPYEYFVALAHSIASHAESLSSLVINLDGIDTSWNHLLKVLLRCKDLSQLVMPAHSEGLVNQCQTLVLGLPRLVMLNIINLERQDVPEGWREGCASRTHTITSIAEDVFDSIPQTASLSLLAFGKAYQFGDRLEFISHSEHCKRWCFFRHQIRDPRMIGLKKAVPIQIPIGQAKYVESKSDLLDIKFPYYP